MALYRNSSDLLTALTRASQTASASIGEMQCTWYAAVQQNRMKNLHFTSVRRYPDPPTLPLPTNVSEIFANETGRFTPERARDIAAPILLYGKMDCKPFFSEQLTKSTGRPSDLSNCNDTHVDSYDCFGAVSLSGTMQSNVPKPFCSNGKSMHLNMPGGEWARDGKYIADDMQKSHYQSTRLPHLKLNKSGLANYAATIMLWQTITKPMYIYTLRYSTEVRQPLDSMKKIDDERRRLIESVPLSKEDRFKRIVKDYGLTIIVFHTAISLISLGACYTAVTSGVDLEPVIARIYETENEKLQQVINHSSTFLLAYSIHKLMAPFRLALTFGTAPLLVKFLRKHGILKPPNVPRFKLK